MNEKPAMLDSALLVEKMVVISNTLNIYCKNYETRSKTQSFDAWKPFAFFFMTNL